MTKEIEEKVHALYEELMEKPREIHQIFNDFFGNDRVDMQGFLAEDALVYNLESNRIGSYIVSLGALKESDGYKNLSDEDKEIVDMLWNKEDCWDVPVLSDDTLAKYYLPVMKEYIGYKLFNNLYILVHFPEVRITNEYDKYVDIKHLWAKVMFNWEGRGKGGFGLNRSHYPISHFKSNYMHSHMGGIPKSDFTYFSTPCTGSGPINTTMATLAIGYDEAIWQLFCLELDRYVRVESIAGTPYHRLEQILSSEETNVRSDFTNRAIKGEVSTTGVLRFVDFTKYLLSNKILPFNYINGSYSVAMSYVDCVVTVSNAFIEWHNDLYLSGTADYKLPDLLSNKILIKAIIKGGEIHYVTVRDDDMREASRYNGEHICFFKGEDITLVIDGAAEDNDNSILLLNPDYVEETVFRLLLVLNYRYGREDKEETTGLGKKVQYI